MRFHPYDRLGDRPNIIVDGAANEHTRLTLSHWPKSGTPRALKADTSAEIVLRYLERPRAHVPRVDIVSNDHFDEDGLLGIYALLNPEQAAVHRTLLCDAASAGDFGTYRDRTAARIAFTISAFADRALSPLPGALFDLPYPRRAATLYEALLPRVPEMLESPGNFRRLWGAEDALLSTSEAAIRGGAIAIDEIARLDLAIVTLPIADETRRVHRFTQARDVVCHPMALHNATRCSRVLLMQGRTYELQFRYETWV